MKLIIISILILFTFFGCSNNKKDEDINISSGETLSAESFQTKSYKNLTSNEVYNLDNMVTIEKRDNSQEDYDYIHLVGTYTSPILTTDNNRYTNIQIVATRLDGQILEPNQVFSYNKVCGPYGKDDGFLEAEILLSDGTTEKGFGGGVCQLSSTLYNAVKNLNVEIIEHHHHSKPVAYVPVNQDATVSLQSNLDFKFKNNYNGNLLFETYCDPAHLTVNVYLEEL
jgi:vancomycin resistance protein YoaR